MKILLITKNIDNKGGLGRYSRSVIDEFNRRGLDFSVLTEGRTGYVAELVILRPLIGGFSEIALSFIANIFAVRRAASSADIVHAFDGWPYGVYGYFAVLGTAKKLFITGIGTYSVAPLKNLVQCLFLCPAYRAARQIFCISDYIKQKISERLLLDNISTVFMGTIRLQELKISEIKNFKIKNSLDKNFPILLTVGDIKKRKGQLDTMRATLFLGDKYPDWKYIMIGSNGDEHYIMEIKKFIKENKIEDHIKIISHMYDDQKLAAFYQASDIFILNSNNDGEHFEGFGLAILEAAQFGKPVIGSEDCGIESAIKDDYNGYLTEQGDTQDIYNKILHTLNEKERLGANSVKWHKNFSWEKTVSEYIKWYNTD